jgi:hypothetical protein
MYIGDDHAKIFGVSRDSKIKSWLVFLAIIGVGVFASYMEGNMVGVLWFLPLAAIAPIATHLTKLTISDDYILRVEGAGFIFKATWDKLDKVIPNGLLATEPVFSYKKWAAPIAWRAWPWFHPPFLRTIDLSMFDKNWIRGEIGAEIAKHRPDLIGQNERTG